MDSKKIKTYENIIMGQTTRVWEHMLSRIEHMPDDFDLLKMSEADLAILDDIDAVEREWITDDEIRRECSIIQFNDSTD